MAVSSRWPIVNFNQVKSIYSCIETIFNMFLVCGRNANEIDCHDT